MGNLHLLVTGDYWHEDFQSVLSSSSTEVLTLAKFDTCCQSGSTHSEHSRTLDGTFDLIVVAVARRNQFDAESIQLLRNRYAPVPLVALLGSWCEGELRSGNPWPGIPRVYWHQWPSMIRWFAIQQQSGQSTSWQLPPTASPGDRILANSDADLPSLTNESGMAPTIAVSALTHDSFSAVADAIVALGGIPVWLEHMEWNALDHVEADVVCIESDGWSPELSLRIQWVRRHYPDGKLIAIANFPRSVDVDEMRLAGVNEVISKPFELAGLAAAMVDLVRNRE